MGDRHQRLIQMDDALGQLQLAVDVANDIHPSRRHQRNRIRLAGKAEQDIGARDKLARLLPGMDLEVGDESANALNRILAPGEFELLRCPPARPIAQSTKLCSRG